MLRPITDPRVWNSVRWLYMGSGLLFLANIGLGVLNVFTPGALPRGQLLAHFHAGTIGWITLSIIATAFWLFLAGRTVTPVAQRIVAGLTIVLTLAVAGYVAAFGLAFNGDGPFWLLPLFGIPSWLAILGATIFVGTQLKKVPVVTTAHLLFFGSLLVGSLGATMGVLWGLTYTTGSYPAPAGGNGIGAHAAPMEMYLGLAFAGIAELLLRRSEDARWTKPGMAQMVLAVVAGFLSSASLWANIIPLAPLSLLLFLISFGFYFARIGRRAFATNPLRPGRGAAIFWGGLFYPLHIIMFVALVALYFIPGKTPPHAVEVLFAHIAFIGAGTNFLLAVQSGWAPGSLRSTHLQAVAHWLLNLGMLLFFAGELVAQRREGALVMAVGVLLGLLVVWTRLGASWHPPAQDGIR